MMRSVDWLLVADVSGQSIGPVFKGQAVRGESFLDYLTLEDGPNNLAETLETNCKSTLHNNPEERRPSRGLLTCTSMFSES
jgi:hypothetical protein